MLLTWFLTPRWFGLFEASVCAGDLTSETLRSRAQATFFVLGDDDRVCCIGTTVLNLGRLRWLVAI